MKGIKDLVLILLYSCSLNAFIHPRIRSRGSLSLALTESIVNTVNVANAPKVPSNAWRFPPRWPFPDDFTLPTSNTSFVTKSYSSGATAGLTKHLSNYVSSRDKVIEIGSQNTPLLKDLTLLSLQHHTISTTDMISSSFTLPYESSSFDHAVINSGLEYFVYPRELFREVWRVLKPGGKCYVSFLDKPVPAEPVAAEPAVVPLSMWVTMNEEQKIWIAGRLVRHTPHTRTYIAYNFIDLICHIYSYFNYSTRFGWADIEG